MILAGVNSKSNTSSTSSSNCLNSTSSMVTTTANKPNRVLSSSLFPPCLPGQTPVTSRSPPPADDHHHQHHSAGGDGESNHFDIGPTGIPLFPWQLHDMLNDAEKLDFINVVSWEQNGRFFKVHQREEFIETILPKYFHGQTQYKSFQRQLNMYGFKMYPTGEHKGAYTHDLLERGRPDLCRFMMRINHKKHHICHSNISSTTTKPRSNSSDNLLVGGNHSAHIPRRRNNKNSRDQELLHVNSRQNNNNNNNTPVIQRAETCPLPLQKMIHSLKVVGPPSSFQNHKFVTDGSSMATMMVGSGGTFCAGIFNQRRLLSGDKVFLRPPEDEPLLVTSSSGGDPMAAELSSDTAHLTFCGSAEQQQQPQQQQPRMEVDEEETMMTTMPRHDCMTQESTGDTTNEFNDSSSLFSPLSVSRMTFSDDDLFSILPPGVAEEIINVFSKN